MKLACIASVLTTLGSVLPNSIILAKSSTMVGL